MEESKSNAIVLRNNVNTVPDVLDLDIKDTEATMKILTNLVASHKLNKVSTPTEALSMYIKTKELGIPFVNSLDHMYEIGGKLGVDVHILRALVLRAGVIHWELIDDYAPLYKYIDNTNMIVTSATSDSHLPDTCIVVKGNNNEEMKTHKDAIVSMGKVPVFKLLDKIVLDSDGKYQYINRVVKYKFTRVLVLGNETKTLVEYGTFSVRDFYEAGLHLRRDGTLNVDSPYIKYQRNQLEQRAWTLGARKIGDDILQGTYTASELFDMNKMNYKVEDGNAVLID